MLWCRGRGPRARGRRGLLPRARRRRRPRVPRARLTARGGALLLGATPPALELELEDPWGDLAAGPLTVELPTLAGYAAWGVDAAGAAAALPTGAGPGLTLDARLSGAGAGPFVRYVLVPNGGAP